MFDRNLMKLPKMPAIMAALVMLALVQAGLVAGQCYFLAAALSQLWEGLTLDAIVAPLSAFIACFATLQLARFGQETMLDRFSRESAQRLRGQLLDGVFDPASMVARSQGAAVVAAAATEGIDDIQTYLRIIPPKMIDMMFVSIPLLVCVFVADWPSGIILLVMFPVIIFFMILLGKQARARSERQYSSYTRLTNSFMDTLRGMRVIKNFEASESEAQTAYRQSEELRLATVRTLTTATLSSAVLDLCATFGVAAVAMMLAFRLMDGSVSLFVGLFALTLAPEYFAPIRAFASDYHASLDGKNALANLLGILDVALSDGGQPDDNPAADDTEEPLNVTAASTLALEDVSYRYESSNAGISGVSLQVRGPRTVCLVGESGSGKSTLANILAGFSAPTGGTIRLDGRPVSLTSPKWRRHVRYVPQTPYIFRATLEDNIRFYRADATRAQVRDVVCAVGLQKLVEELPHGLDTLVGEGARGLSGGEAHRVALARILLDDQARILVFDEPTAHLDIQTELDLKPVMLQAMSGRLVFFATHRLHWLDDMDEVFDLDGHKLAREASAAGEPSGQEALS